MKKKLSSLTAEVRCGLGKVEWLSLRSTRSGPDADADARPSSWRMKLKSEKRCSQRLSMTLSKWWRCPSGRIWYLISLGVVKHLGSWHWQLVRSGCQTLVSWWLPQIPTFYPTLIGNYSHPLGESLSNLSTNQHHYVSLVFFQEKEAARKEHKKLRAQSRQSPEMPQVVAASEISERQGIQGRLFIITYHS